MMLKFIADFANWDNAAKPKYLKTGQALVRAAHPDKVPLVVDPFAGGGSIPLEALRLGCEAFASDINPVAGLILKVMLEDVPRHGPELVDGLRRAGAMIRRQRRGNWPACIRPTRMVPRRSPVSGPVRCAAKHPAAARRFPSCGRCGSRGEPNGSGLCT